MNENLDGPVVLNFSDNFATELCKLCDGLQRAFCDPSDDGPKHSRAETLRARYIVALGKLSRFFDAINPDSADADLAARGVAMRLMELSAMLQDLNEGICHPVLKASDRSGRKVRFDVWIVRDMVVRGVQVLVMSGMDVTVAARTIAARFPSLNRLKRDERNDLATVILSWEKNLREGTVSNEIIRDVYGAGVELLNKRIEKAGPNVLQEHAEELKAAGYKLVERAAARARALVMDNDFSSEPTTIWPTGKPPSKSSPGG